MNKGLSERYLLPRTFSAVPMAPYAPSACGSRGRDLPAPREEAAGPLFSKTRSAAVTKQRIAPSLAWHSSYCHDELVLPRSEVTG